MYNCLERRILDVERETRYGNVLDGTNLESRMQCFLIPALPSFTKLAFAMKDRCTVLTEM